MATSHELARLRAMAYSRGARAEDLERLTTYLAAHPEVAEPGRPDPVSADVHRVISAPDAEGAAERDAASAQDSEASTEDPARVAAEFDTEPRARGADAARDTGARSRIRIGLIIAAAAAAFFALGFATAAGIEARQPGPAFDAVLRDGSWSGSTMSFEEGGEAAHLRGTIDIGHLPENGATIWASFMIVADANGTLAPAHVCLETRSDTGDGATIGCVDYEEFRSSGISAELDGWLVEWGPASGELRVVGHVL